MNIVKLIHKIINFIISFTILVSLSTNLTFSQGKINETVDSGKESYINMNLSTEFDKVFGNKKIFLGQKDYSISVQSDYFYSIQRTAPKKSLMQLKNDMRIYLQKRRLQLPDYELGEFGKYLGYANSAAVILLAIAHLSKYGIK